MARPNAYTTVQRARSLRERQPDASPSHVAIAVIMATFADGPTGSMIRPGYARVASLTGLHADTVRRAIHWLVERGELRRDKDAWRGSAACFTYTGGAPVKVGPDTPPFDGKAGPETRNGGASHHTHPSHPLEPSGPPGPRPEEASQAGKQQETCAGCGGPLGYLIEGDTPADGALCLTCFHGR
jgi:hypothetical protein